MKFDPKPVVSPRCDTQQTHCHLLKCPECGAPTLYAESVDYSSSPHRGRDPDMAMTRLICRQCCTRVTVETEYRRMIEVRDIEETLPRRAWVSLRDPEQEKRDAAAADIERMARELTAKAARVRRGELP